VVAGLFVPGSDGKPTKQIPTCGPLTRDRLALSDGVVAAKCALVAMASTGGWWKPIDTVRERSCALLVVNAQPLQAVPGVPGRTTAVRAAEGIADPQRALAGGAPAASRIRRRATCAR
jgi:hypothetical protein